MSKIRKKIIVFLIGFFIYAFSSLIPHLSSFVYAAVPHLLNYQGRLTDSNGSPLNGSYSLTFRIYDAESAGNLLWEETQGTVVIQKGIFSVLLGSATNLNLPFDKPYFLEIKVGNEVMSPRQQITSSGYAIRAEKAEVAESADSINIPAAQKGDVLFYDGSKWTRLSVGTNGDFLQTKGSGANPAWAPVIVFWVPTNIQVFTSSGTWIRPPNINKVYVKVWGAGGGGGGGRSATNSIAGGGGGGGGYSEGMINVSGNVTVTVGAGGLAGVGSSSPGSGTNGGYSSFAGDSTIQANGGVGGIGGSSGGAGGSASGGSINLTGIAGQNGGGTGEVLGGDSYFGGCGGTGGKSGKKYGGGGGGGLTGPSPGGHGGAGADGCVIVYY
jgi:hypothetical protein